MANGLKVWDELGNVILDVSNSITRILGITDTGTVNGSVTNADFSLGVPWYCVIPKDTGSGTIMSWGLTPVITFASNTMTWTWSSTTYARNCTIIYGTR